MSNYQPFTKTTIRADMYACTRNFRDSALFPFDTGRMKSFTHSFATNDGYCIKINGTLAPYVEYLETGTLPHDIPNAFGRGYNFGIGGRFNGKFHPGSMKHKEFIEHLIEREIIPYYQAQEIALLGNVYARDSWANLSLKTNIKRYTNSNIATSFETSTI